VQRQKCTHCPTCLLLFQLTHPQADARRRHIWMRRCCSCAPSTSELFGAAPFFRLLLPFYFVVLSPTHQVTVVRVCDALAYRTTHSQSLHSYHTQTAGRSITSPTVHTSHTSHAVGLVEDPDAGSAHVQPCRRSVSSPTNRSRKQRDVKPYNHFKTNSEP
jgi:hypothetical protein